MNLAQPRVPELTLTQEFRLRKWARANYISGDERDDRDWHPVVLNEMQLKDQEMTALQTDVSIARSFVPLAPGVTRTVHQAHREMIRPNILRYVSQEAETFIAW